MGELEIRRTRGFAVPQYQSVKVEKQTSASQIPKAAKATVTVSETLQQLMSRVSQTEGRARESRRTLQTGEGVLAEVKDSLDRIAELAKKAAGGGSDRAALQAELEQLRTEIDRMIRGASSGEASLFLDEELDLDDGTDALLHTLIGEMSAKSEAAQLLPDWLMKGMAQNPPPTAEQLLAGLGLDKTASGSELLAAIANSSLEDNSAAGCLAALYLGSVIAGGRPEAPDTTEALSGLVQLLEKVSRGVPLDEAIEQLTNGVFTSLEDFQAQFTGGTLPGLQDFLTGLLLADSASAAIALPAPSLLSMLAGIEGMNLDLVMGLLSVTQGTQAGAEAAAPELEAMPSDPSPVSVVQLGNVQVMGRDLSGVSFDSAAGVLTVDGSADVVIQGTGQEPQAVLLTGSGTVTLQGVNVSTLTVDAPTARVVTAGESTLNLVQLREGTALTIGGGGVVRLDALQGGRSNTLRLTDGAALMPGNDREALAPTAVCISSDGPAILAAQAGTVRSVNGSSMELFDVVWKAMLPNWSSVTSMTVDGARLAFGGETRFEFARLWLDRVDPSHGNPVHTLVLRGRDASGRPQTRYTYLHWNQSTKRFEEFSMYPNPFAVTGGEAGRDWVYEEETQTLHILSNQVTGISGGSGTDGNQGYFSGRIALADQIGTTELTLGGAVCRVSSGRAFSLGRGNDVTLILRSGTINLFESGAGCAGISLGDGTTLSIDCDTPHSGRNPAGALTASGSTGGAGIGRDSGAGRDRLSRILIRGGMITAAGSGGGAGIGAGRHGFMGHITILGGTVTSTGGSGGGAGIGGALGAPVGDISIHGGIVTAEASYHAAAIGAGIQGECGDILITGTARIVKALGGDPGADIGACLFGRCGNVLISGGADIGTAKLRTRAGVPLQMGEDTVILPQFRLSSRALRLDRMSLLTRESAQAAGVTIEADRRWVSQIQEAYSALYSRLEESLDGIYNVHQYVIRTDSLVRDTASASTLLKDVSQYILRQSSQALRSHSRRSTEDVRQLLR